MVPFIIIFILQLLLFFDSITLEHPPPSSPWVELDQVPRTGIEVVADLPLQVTKPNESIHGRAVVSAKEPENGTVFSGWPGREADRVDRYLSRGEFECLPRQWVEEYQMMMRSSIGHEEKEPTVFGKHDFGVFEFGRDALWTEWNIFQRLNSKRRCGPTGGLLGTASGDEGSWPAEQVVARSGRRNSTTGRRV
ncbi:CRISPR-associated Csn2 family protein [Striga asiatica]|uniref:CRISPR-associated Csn2 family protein n=1 Tax=Striga asiatica TaxID=4170 RepID=A0A5A7R4Z5_STRAF|nr:CRISPR-associated Csn2 family protein [Striga asiatica]